MHKVPGWEFPLYKEYKLALPTTNSFKKRISQFKPDIIHLNSPETLGYAALKYAEKNDIPVVATYHTHFTSYFKYYHMDMLEPLIWPYLRRFYNRCDKVYVPSLPMMQELKSHGLKKIEYLPHGVDTKVFNPEYRSIAWRKKYGVDRKIVILLVSRLVWYKDLKLFVDIYDKLQNNNNVTFVLVGKGPDQPELEKLMPKAIFLGHQTGKALSTAYASGDIFLFPSTTETFGNVVIEAMASGLPCVCANVGGPKGIISDGITGYLSKPNDINSFMKNINMLLKSKKLRKKIADKGLEHAKAQSWDNICDDLVKSYNDVIMHHKKKSYSSKKTPYF
jgi:glycosyltransferase involved in cell wall biosynthesis